MDYTTLKKEYWERQQQRVARHSARLSERGVSLTKGLAIPADGDLPIGEGRRLHMAVLFLDICSFTSMPNHTKEEQERIMRAFTIFFAEMIRTVEDYEGTVEKNTGDGLMAYFEDAGYDTNGCTRAVAAAMTMFAVHTHIVSPLLAAEGLAPIDFRIGIDSGFVTVAEVGASRGFHGVVAIGITPNIAAKILKVANAGEIVMGAWVGKQLPTEWQQHLKMHTEHSGFTQTIEGEPKPYPFHKFAAHWTLPS